jgi:uncharacterized protein (DUF1778 family)
MVSMTEQTPRLELRSDAATQRLLRIAAAHAGLTVSAWVRSRVRRDALEELRTAGVPTTEFEESSANEPT